MQGYQPAARRLAQLPDKPQHLADGGAVGFGARGLAGLRQMIPLVQAMGYPQQQAASPAPAPAPAADTRTAQLQAMIPRMEAMGFKQQPQQPQYLARGGMVRGPGTGTSDSIPDEAEPGTFIMPADSTETIGPSALEKMGTVPVRLSDGEYKFPPEQVMAIGEAVLKFMKDATHTPVNGVDGGQTDEEVEEARGSDPGAAERMAEMPEQLYADGGRVENDVTRVGNSYSGGNVGGSITVNGAAPAGTFSENPAARLAAPPAPRPATTTAVSMIRATPPTSPATPPTVATPAAAAPMGWQARQDQRNLEVSASSIMDSPERRAAQERLGMLPAAGFQPRRYADGGTVEDDFQKRLAQIPTGGPAGWTGGGQAAAPAPVAASTTPAAAPQAPSGALSRAASYVAPSPVPSLAAQAMSASPQPQPLSDRPISTQNMDAAQGLASRGAADALAQLPNAPQQSVQTPLIRHSGIDWQARNDLRNLEVSAKSITADGGRFDRNKGESPEALAYRAALGTDAALRGSAPALAQQAMREQGDTQRAGLQVTAANANSAADRMGALERTLITERGNNTRAGLSAMATTEAARLKAQQENKPPAGYRWAEGGTKLEPIPGGPAGDGKPLTEDQAKSAGYALRMDNALKLIDEVGKTNPSAVRPGLATRAINALPEGAANMLRSGDRQRVEAAQLDALDAALTLNTGAAYTREQLQGLSRSYFAQPSDDDQTVIDKQNRLQSLIDTARLRAGEKGSAMTDAAQAKNAARTGAAPAADVSPQIAELQRRAATNPALAARLKELGY